MLSFDSNRDRGYAEASPGGNHGSASVPAVSISWSSQAWCTTWAGAARTAAESTSGALPPSRPGGSVAGGGVARGVVIRRYGASRVPCVEPAPTARHGGRRNRRHDQLSPVRQGDMLASS